MSQPSYFVGALQLFGVVLAEGTDEYLEVVQTYRFGESSEVLEAVEYLVSEAAKGPDGGAALAQKLAATLPACQSAEAKQFICRQLSIIGTPETAPALAPLLHDPVLSNDVRIALQQIPGEAVDEMLIDAAKAGPAEVRPGILTTLGARRAHAAIDVLGEAALSEDPLIASAAARALGQIGGKRGARALAVAHMAQKDEAVQRDIADARLICAENLAAAGEARAALFIYRSIYFENQNPPQARAAALRGLDKLAPTTP